MIYHADEEDLKLYFTTNRTPYKEAALPFLEEILELNKNLNEEDIYTIISPEFYDDIYDSDLGLDEVLEKHWLHHTGYDRGSFIALHDFYNR